MRVIHQIGQECLLAAMCAVSGKDYYRARHHYQPWDEHLATADLVLKRACENHFPEVWPVVSKWPTDHTKEEVMKEFDAITRTPLPNEAMDFRGKGIIAIISQCPRGCCLIGCHALAFEDWNIFDSATGSVYDWLTFARIYEKKYHVRFHVVAIIHAK